MYCIDTTKGEVIDKIEFENLIGNVKCLLNSNNLIANLKYCNLLCRVK